MSIFGGEGGKLSYGRGDACSRGCSTRGLLRQSHVTEEAIPTTQVVGISRASIAALVDGDLGCLSRDVVGAPAGFVQDNRERVFIQAELIAETIGLEVAVVYGEEREKSARRLGPTTRRRQRDKRRTHSQASKLC